MLSDTVLDHAHKYLRNLTLHPFWGQMKVNSIELKGNVTAALSLTDLLSSPAQVFSFGLSDETSDLKLCGREH